MTRADDHLAIYRDQITALRRAHVAGQGGDYAQPFASFGAGVLYGAGFPQAAATMAELYRRAYPGQPFPIIWEGEA